MVAPPEEVTLELNPETRLDVINVAERVNDEFGHVLTGYRKAVYHSYHTTAGYLDERVCARFHHDRQTLQDWVRHFQDFFPPNGDYQHDKMDLRSELTEEQRRQEPLNADSHLTFIGAGLANCVTYVNDPATPVYFVDLDGTYENTRRKRHTTVIGFSREKVVGKTLMTVPVSSHPIDSINLKGSRLGIFEELNQLIEEYDIKKGRIDITLAPTESHAGLTVNEYETMLMKHDLAEVLARPFGFMAERGKHMLRHPSAIPGKALNYAKYDLVLLVNQFLDTMHLSGSLLERVIDKFLALPASRFLWMKRSISLLVSDANGASQPSIVQGTYQSPILVQWKKARNQSRRLNVSLVRFD